MISEEIPSEKKVYEESSVMSKAPYCWWDSQAPKKNHPKRWTCIPKNPQEIIPGIFYQARSKQDHPKRRGPKTFLSTKNDSTQKMQNIRWHLYNLLKPWKTLDFLLEIHVGWNHPSFPCKGTSPRWVAPQVAKMGPGPMVIDGVLYNPYKWLEING